jgi:hypothetical protein
MAAIPGSAGAFFLDLDLGVFTAGRTALRKTHSQKSTVWSVASQP